MFGLTDVKSFNASVEKAFQPSLRKVPVCILSNECCVIARSKEPKKYIKMGESWFKIKNHQYPVKIHFSFSNYAPYHSMNTRVTTWIEEMVPRKKVHFVNEGFCNCRGIFLTMIYENLGRMIRSHVLQFTGLTVGCDLAPTKTLAKSAQWASKE